MFEIVFLGTSASAPSIHRGLSSIAVLAGEERFLVDCGEGTQRQILRSGIGFKRLTHILLTHPHLDHILGLGGLVSTLTRWETLDSLDIWGSQQTLERVEALIYQVVLRHQVPPIPIHLNTVGDDVLFENKHFTVRAFPVIHRGKGCYGYIFEEKVHRPFLADKAKALGVPVGPERSQLVKGDSITLADGHIITPNMVLGDPVKGTKIVFTGDIAQTDNIIEYVRDADALVIESTFLDTDSDIAHKFGHITAKQAAEFAIKANVRDVLMTHVSRRYRERDIVHEAKETYASSVVVRDLDHFIVRHSQPIEKVISDENSH